MKTIPIDPVSGFEAWRDAARACLFEKIPPGDISWHAQGAAQEDLFSQATLTPLAPSSSVAASKVPAAFLDLARTAACHSDPEKYDLLYRILWRLSLENRHLLNLATDNDILKLRALVKAVRKDAYKITAFLRFRQITFEGMEHFIAWYEPEHYTLERVIPFFQTRFRNMRWSILTPYRAAHWDGEAITLEDNPVASLYPKDDQVEQYWLTYYANIFNPARTKKTAMLNQMPKKYWKNMPETALVPTLLRNAEAKARDMVEKSRQKTGK